MHFSPGETFAGFNIALARKALSPVPAFLSILSILADVEHFCLMRSVRNADCTPSKPLINTEMSGGVLRE